MVEAISHRWSSDRQYAHSRTRDLSIGDSVLIRSRLGARIYGGVPETTEDYGETTA